MNILHVKKNPNQQMHEELKIFDSDMTSNCKERQQIHIQIEVLTKQLSQWEYHYSGSPQVSKALAMSIMCQFPFNFEHILGFGTVVKKILIQSEYKIELADIYISPAN